MIELFGGYHRSHLDLLDVGEVLTGQTLPTEHSPPRLLQIEPGRAFEDEHLLYPGYQPVCGSSSVLRHLRVGGAQISFGTFTSPYRPAVRPRAYVYRL
jgi:hypothetical protein